MLIKIQSQNNSNTFNIIDNCSEVSFSVEPEYCYSEKELNERILKISKHCMTLHLIDESVTATLFATPIGEDVVHAKIDFSENYYRFHWIRYIDHESQPQAIILDGTAYICNNEGKTVHRLNSTGVMTLPPSTHGAVVIDKDNRIA